MIDGLKEFVVMIKDFILSLINGLATLVEALAHISGISSQASWWMPSALFSVMILALTLIIVLRIVGR